MKKTLSPQINVVRKVLGFWQQNLARFKIDIGGKGGRGGFGFCGAFEFEKLSHFSNFLNFQRLSQEDLSRFAGNF